MEKDTRAMVANLHLYIKPIKPPHIKLVDQLYSNVYANLLASAAVRWE